MSRRTLTIALALVLSAAPALTAPAWAAGAEGATLSDLDWMVGDWRAGDDGAVRLETWTEAAGGMMLGVHLDVLASGRTGYEFLRLVAEDEGIVYYAAPAGRHPATPFRLVELGDRRAVFANPAHDFPKRIVYWIAEDGALHAHAQGDDGQGPEWRWERR